MSVFGGYTGKQTNQEGLLRFGNQRRKGIVPGQHPENTQQAETMFDSFSHQSFQPEWIAAIPPLRLVTVTRSKHSFA